MTLSLARVLETAHNGHDRLATLQVEYRDWMVPRPASSRLRVAVRTDAGEPMVRWNGAGPWPRGAATTRKYWSTGGDRLRVEARDAGSELVTLAVRDVDRWSIWTRRGGVTEGLLSGPEHDLLPRLLDPPLLHPASILAKLRLEGAWAGERMGREVVCIRGATRAAASGDRRIELELDPVHGTLLRRAVYDGTQIVHTTEAVKVRYDDEIAGETYTFRRPQ